jgi:hypothetical protein
MKWCDPPGAMLRRIEALLVELAACGQCHFPSPRFTANVFGMSARRTTSWPVFGESVALYTRLCVTCLHSIVPAVLRGGTIGPVIPRKTRQATIDSIQNGFHPKANGQCHFDTRQKRFNPFNKMALFSAVYLIYQCALQG